ncbi:MAG: hypothetical protein O3B04_07965 [Chloroflexi bacterium]|nr:hypothetical protein [Chloroflexota bacterium]
MKVTGISLDVVEREAPDARVSDHPGGNCGIVRNGVLRRWSDQGDHAEAAVPA